MRTWVYLLFLCLLKSAVPQNSKSRPRKSQPFAVEVYHYENCPDHKDLKNYFKDMVLSMDPDTDVLYVTGILHMEAPIYENTRQSFEVRKCLNKDELTCEKYVDYDVGNMCEILPKKNTSWSPFIKAIENFDPHCPLKPGDYKVVNGPVDTGSVLTSVSALQGHWRLRYVASNNNKVITCLNTAVLMTRKRG